MSSLFLRIFAWVGVASWIAAGYLYALSIRERNIQLQPLVLPISLAVGTIKTPAFRTDVSYWQYEIDIECDPGHNPPRTECLLGGASLGGQCADTPDVLDISWELHKNGVIVTRGNSGNQKGITAITGIAVERPIGIFRGEAGAEYTLVLHVKRDGSQLNYARPRLVVQILQGYWNDRAMGIAAYQIIAGLLALFGAVCLLPYARQLVKRRKGRV